MSEQYKSKDPAQAPGIAEEARSLRDSVQSLQLATSDATGNPLASYTPFALLEDESFCILTSRLSAHTQNLLASNVAAVLLIESESSAKNIFARRRLACQCRVTHRARDTEEFTVVVEALTRRFGAMAQQLAQLPDFEAFELAPFSASFVRGFGSAFQFAGGELRDAKQLVPNQ